MPLPADARQRPANAQPERPERRYVLYWTQAYRRLAYNHALDFALARARELGKPLVVYEGLRLDYPWANQRTHSYMLDGMRDNAATAKQLGVNYWPFVATPEASGRGLLRQLAANACHVVTDDYPCFIVPAQTAALATKTDVAVTAIDGNSLVPLKLLGAAVSAAAHLRPRIHKLFADAWGQRAAAEPDFPKDVRRVIAPPFALATLTDKLLAPLDASVPPVKSEPGGRVAGLKRLAVFLKQKLHRYGTERNEPGDPAESAASGLSGYLRHGHLSIQEIAEAVLGDGWTPARLDVKCRGKRAGYYTGEPDRDSYLDEAITWRDVGYQWHYHRAADTASLERALPPWALASLTKHEPDPRTHTYTLEEWEAADTHDPLWNAAQTELVKAGRIHNYLRMLWGKKVLEWSRTPGEAYRVLEHLNNKYAVDGRDPNSYTGILWCFGLFDRPWPPERPVFGNVRYMSSDNTAKKFKLAGYYDYVRRLPSA